MSGDVAVHEPASGVVRLEGNHGVPAGEGHDHIPSGWIIAAEEGVIGTGALDIVGVEFLIGLVDYGKVVAVEMNLWVVHVSYKECWDGWSGGV